MIRVVHQDGVDEHPAGDAAVEMDSGSLVVAEEINDADEPRTLAIYAPGYWRWAKLVDDTRDAAGD